MTARPPRAPPAPTLGRVVPTPPEAEQGRKLLATVAFEAAERFQRWKGMTGASRHFLPSRVLHPVRQASFLLDSLTACKLYSVLVAPVKKMLGPFLQLFSEGVCT